MDRLQKLFLFRWFFTGRPDIYARRQNNEQGHASYKFIREPLTDDLLMAHMSGRELLGSYPILRDNTTRWAAADFDGKNGNAFEHAAVLVGVLKGLGIVPICNVSQSGHGVHVRIVFADSRRPDPRLPSVPPRPVHAAIAHRLMLKAVELAELPHVDDGGAFDRVFPTQDFLRTAKSIGNQLALPLNKRAADERGGTLLLDEDFRPIPLSESWDFMVSYRLLSMLDLYDAATEMGATHYVMECVDENNNFLSDSQYDDVDGEVIYKRNSQSQRTINQLKLLIKSCDFIRWAIMNPALVQYNLWFAIASQFAMFDQVGGRGAFHQLSSRDTGYDDKGKPRYSAEYTDRTYESALTTLRSNYSCRRIAEDGFRCRWLDTAGYCGKFGYEGGIVRFPASLPERVERLLGSDQDGAHDPAVSSAKEDAA